MESCTQIGQWRTMTSVPASAQSDSRLYCAAESEIDSIVTVGAPLATFAFSKIELEGETFTSRVKSRLEKNNAFRLAHLLLPRLAG